MRSSSGCCAGAEAVDQRDRRPHGRAGFAGTRAPRAAAGSRRSGRPRSSRCPRASRSRRRRSRRAGGVRVAEPQRVGGHVLAAGMRTRSRGLRRCRGCRRFAASSRGRMSLSVIDHEARPPGTGLTQDTAFRAQNAASGDVVYLRSWLSPDHRGLAQFRQAVRDSARLCSSRPPKRARNGASKRRDADRNDEGGEWIEQIRVRSTASALAHGRVARLREQVAAIGASPTSVKALLPAARPVRGRPRRRADLAARGRAGEDARGADDRRAARSARQRGPRGVGPRREVNMPMDAKGDEVHEQEDGSDHGCSTGIGKLAAKTFHEKGWNVVATMRSPGARDRAHRRSTDVLGLEARRRPIAGTSRRRWKRHARALRWHRRP